MADNKEIKQSTEVAKSATPLTEQQKVAGESVHQSSANDDTLPMSIVCFKLKSMGIID